MQSLPLPRMWGTRWPRICRTIGPRARRAASLSACRPRIAAWPSRHGQHARPLRADPSGLDAADQGRASPASFPGDRPAATRRLARRDRRRAASPATANDRDLREGGRRRVCGCWPSRGRCGRCAMTALRRAIDEYLALRRRLGRHAARGGARPPPFRRLRRTRRRGARDD